MDFNILLVILIPFLFIVFGSFIGYFVISKLIDKWKNNNRH